MNQETTNNNEVAANQVRLLLPTLPMELASADELLECLRSTYRVEYQAATILTETVAELCRRQGREATESFLRETGMSRRQARLEIEAAQKRQRLSGT